MSFEAKKAFLAKAWPQKHRVPCTLQM